MGILVKRIILISILIMILSLLDFLDNQIISIFNFKDEGIFELIVDFIAPIIEISLLLWALITGKNIICKIKAEEEQYKRLVQLSPEAIFIHDRGNILYINENGANLFGSSSNELINCNISEFIHYDSMDLYNSLIEGYNTINDISQNIKIKRVDGAIIDLETKSTKIDFKGQFAREVIARDITIQKSEMENVKQLAFKDELTGLPNRRAFMEQLTTLLNSHKSERDSFSIMFIDLDGFKQVNDTLGHEGGDIVLKHASENFKRCVGNKGMTARLAGDEFIILISNISHNEHVIIAKEIIESFSSSFIILGKRVRVTPSIGIALYPQHGEEATELIKNADMAMYEAKQSGKNKYRMYQT